MNATMDSRSKLMAGCRQLAASAWCDKTTSHCVMIPAVAEQFAKILYEVFQTAALVGIGIAPPRPTAISGLMGDLSMNAKRATTEQSAPVEQPAPPPKRRDAAMEAYFPNIGGVPDFTRGTKPATADQPAPAPNRSLPIWELVIEDMKKRDHVGRQRYGTPLQANNGRDALVDAYQEALDLAVYLRQAIEERAHARAVAQAAAHASKDAVPKDLDVLVAGVRPSIDALRDAARAAGDGVLNFRERDRHVMTLHNALDTLERIGKNCATAPLTPQRGAV